MRENAELLALNEQLRARLAEIGTALGSLTGGPRRHPEVDFCVRALRRDGLRVASFDQHADGDASLRDADVRAWWDWQTHVA